MGCEGGAPDCAGIAELGEGQESTGSPAAGWWPSPLAAPSPSATVCIPPSLRSPSIFWVNSVKEFGSH